MLIKYLRESACVYPEPLDTVHHVPHGDPSAKKEELSWFPFPLEKPQIVRQFTIMSERTKNRTCHIVCQNVASSVASKKSIEA